MNASEKRVFVNVGEPSKVKHSGTYILLFVSAWVLQFILLGIVVVGGNYLVHGTRLNDVTYFVLMKYLIFPISVLLPSLLITYSAYILQKSVSGYFSILKFIQPSLIIASILFFGPEPEYGWKFSAIATGITGYLPVILVYRSSSFQRFLNGR